MVLIQGCADQRLIPKSIALLCQPKDLGSSEVYAEPAEDLRRMAPYVAPIADATTAETSIQTQRRYLARVRRIVAPLNDDTSDAGRVRRAGRL